MATVALEFVPPAADRGPEKAREEAARVRDLLRDAGLEGHIDTLVVPGMIPEEGDRPVPLEDKMDPLELRLATRDVLPLDCIVTQVTAFSSAGELERRLRALADAGVGRVVFVGVPRTLGDGQGPGLAPTEAIERFRDRVAQRGVILIPTRDDEAPRFEAKVRSGANFALCQLLFSDHMTRFVPTLELDGPRPEILLSFGYVPRAEERIGLIRWLIRDQTQLAQDEMRWVGEIATLSFARKKQALVDVYKRVVDGLVGCGFPLGVHFECPYGFNPYAFEVFRAMLEHGLPEAGDPGPLGARGRARND